MAAESEILATTISYLNPVVMAKSFPDWSPAFAAKSDACH
jgi:hypothetical protein